MDGFKPYFPATAKNSFQNDKRFHVFMSFKGKDVRTTLVDHLYEALSAAGLQVFLDSYQLKKGEIIDLSLETAIESSAIRIPIFSKGYANSAWCLREAAVMLSSPGLIIPLFYDVKPTHVRYPENESSPYKKSFLKHYGHSDRFRTEEVDGWKYALEQICSCSGWSMDITAGFEAQLVKKVVNDIISTLDRVPLEVAKHPVGLESVKNALIQKLNLSSAEDVVRVGIWGIGGIGKTTVAKAVHNEVYGEFTAASFVFNVRAIAAEASGLIKMQGQILKDLVKYGGEVHSVDKGKSLLRDRLRGMRALVLLDDVDDGVQLDALVGDWLAPGSRVIITSRDKHILNIARVSSEMIHEMCGLEKNEGLQLFSWHAFLRSSPSPDYEDHSKRIVEACKGHPLSLEVIGAFLYDKKNDTDIDCWNEALDNITVNRDIFKTLHISYSALSDEEKEIFLDIACFFIGEDATYPIVFWKSLYKNLSIAITNLSMKLLIKIDNEGVFDMHDHVRDMGRSIAEKEGTRLWEAAHSSSLFNNISSQCRNTNISRLQLMGGNSKRLRMLYTPNLHYLHLQHLHIQDMIDMLLPSLIWLRLDYCSFAIEMDSSNLFKDLTLAVKKITGSSLEGNNWQLRVMELKECSGLKSLPSTIGNFSQLRFLKLQCRDLKQLPNTIGNLSQLQSLNLSRCEKLNNLPYSICNLTQLQYLDLSYNVKICDLPCNIGYLSQLRSLDLTFLMALKKLPDTLGNLSQLQSLNLNMCVNLNNLPYTIGNLSQLQYLDLTRCDSLNNLPQTIGNLSCLLSLNLSGCKKLNNLPHTIGNLSQLQYLELTSCDSLNNLPQSIGNLSQMQSLKLGKCGKLNNLPHTIGNLSQLQCLNLFECKLLNNLPDTIGNLLQLQSLDLSFCVNLNNLPDTIGNLSELKSLTMCRCRNLENLPGTIGNLSQLQYLNLTSCRNLNNLPNTIGDLSQLQDLNLTGCKKLNNLPDTIGNLSHLQSLSLKFCSSLQNLPETTSNLSQLKSLEIQGCYVLQSIPDAIMNQPKLWASGLPPQLEQKRILMEQ